MLYSLVFALIYFAVLGIIIIFDMKNRKKYIVAWLTNNKLRYQRCQVH